MEVYKNTEWKDVILNGESKELPVDWDFSFIKKLTKVTSGGTPSTKEKMYWDKKEIKWLSSGEVCNKKIYDTEKYISKEGLKSSSAKLIPSKSVLIALAGQGKTRGQVGITEVELSTNQSVGAILPSDTFNSDYLFLNLLNRYKELRLLSGGDNGRGGLNLEIIKNLDVMLPPSQQQAAIASLLSSQESIVQKTKALIANIEKRNQFMMDELLSGRLRIKEENGQILFYKNPDENWSEVKINGEAVEIPKDWDSFKLEKHITCNMGETILSANIKQSSFANAIPVISASQDEKFFGYIDKKIVKKVLRKGDLTICARGSIGFPRIVKEDVASTQTTIQVRSDKLDLNYLCHFFNANHAKFFNSTGGAVPQLTLGMVNDFEITQPKNKTEMDQILNIINSLTKEKQKYEQILEKEEKTFTFLLEELMSGRLRIKI